MIYLNIENIVEIFVLVLVLNNKKVKPQGTSSNCDSDADCGTGCCTSNGCRCYVGTSFSGTNGNCAGTYSWEL